MRYLQWYAFILLQGRANMNKTRNIAIIGAGLAGLSAAASLSAAEQMVTLFDGGMRIGGRLGTEYDADLGAQYFTVRDSAFHHATRDWQSQGYITEWLPRIFHYTHEQGLQPSTDTIMRQVGTPSMQALAEHLALDYHIHPLTIQRLQRTETGQWLLMAAHDQTFGPFDQVIIATAPADASALLEVAPQLQSSVKQVSMLPCWSMAVYFSAPLPTEVDACFVRTGGLDWIARNNSKPNRPATEVWVLQSTADWAQAHTDTDPQQVARELLTAMGKVLDLPMLSPTATHTHFWPAAKSADVLQWGALAAPELGLYVCGDWCMGGRVENAWLSGRQAAQALLDS